VSKKKEGWIGRGISDTRIVPVCCSKTRKQTQRQVGRDLEEEQIDKKGEVLQCLMQTTCAFR